MAAARISREIGPGRFRRRRPGAPRRHLPVLFSGQDRCWPSFGRVPVPSAHRCGFPGPVTRAHRLRTFSRCASPGHLLSGSRLSRHPEQTLALSIPRTIRRGRTTRRDGFVYEAFEFVKFEGLIIHIVGCARLGQFVYGLRPSVPPTRSFRPLCTRSPP